MPPRPASWTTLVLGITGLGVATCGAPAAREPPPERAARPVSSDHTDHTDRGRAPPPLAGSEGDYPYISDLGDGRYRNPVVLADYSDPDPIRVGSDFYLVASSFNCTPGLPILHSRDLVNWTLVGHAIQQLPGERFAKPQIGQGVWAPSIRSHAGTYYISYPIYCKPADGGACAEEGIWVVTAPHPLGPWSAPHQLLAATGVIDPALFWDDDGRAYLVQAYARSRAGFGSRIDIRPMAPDASVTLGPGQAVYSDASRHPTIEGPKMYKRNGWYYILAPAGGVTTGWQVALRSRAVFGPYQDRIILQQGSTDINGPHQGGLVDTPDGAAWWFLHFQDLGRLGRVVHLNPVTWRDEWPLVGVTPPGAGTDLRQPVAVFTKPALPRQPIPAPQTSDEFPEGKLALQWQWQANHQDSWWSLVARPGWLRLYTQDCPGADVDLDLNLDLDLDLDLDLAPNLLLQKVPARAFDVETIVDLSGARDGDGGGLVVWGEPTAALMVQRSRASPGIIQLSLNVAGKSLLRTSLAVEGNAPPLVRLRAAFDRAGRVQFDYAGERAGWRILASRVDITSRRGSWIGVKVGLVSLAAAGRGGWLDFDYVRFAPHGRQPP